MLESDGRARSPLPGAAGEQLPISTSAVPVVTPDHPPRMTKVISFDNLESRSDVATTGPKTIL
jgi:hypothetical protein